MTELVALEVKIALTAQGMGDKTNHLVQSHATVNAGCKFTEG
jgi:hypothetical protein